MKSMERVSLALVARLAIGMVASTSALAAAEVENAETHSKNLTSETTTGKLTSSTVVLTTAGGTALTCKGDTNESTYTTAQEGTGTQKFTSCEVTGGFACKTAGAAAKEISFKPVSYLNGSTLELGLLLLLRNASNISEVVVTCSNETIKVYGSVIGAVDNWQHSAKSFLVLFNLNGSNEQAIPDTEHPLLVCVGSSATEKATESGHGALNYKSTVIGIA